MTRSFEVIETPRLLIPAFETADAGALAGIMPLCVNWRRGYATEAASAIRNDAFDRAGLHELHANMPFDHLGSQRVAERIGMRKIGAFFHERNRSIRIFLYKQSREDRA